MTTTFRHQLAAQAMIALLEFPKIRDGFDDVLNDEITIAEFADSIADDAITLADSMIARLSLLPA